MCNGEIHVFSEEYWDKGFNKATLWKACELPKSHLSSSYPTHCCTTYLEYIFKYLKVSEEERRACGTLERPKNDAKAKVDD